VEKLQVRRAFTERDPNSPNGGSTPGLNIIKGWNSIFPTKIFSKEDEKS